MQGFFSVADDYSGRFDRLGDPIPENRGKRGRPPDTSTEKNHNKIKLLLALSWANRRVARALRTAGKTLSRHYFRELRQRDEARPAPGCLGLATFERAGQHGATPR
jgi:hypothetical protein